LESANGVLGCKPRSRPAARPLASSPVRSPRRPLARSCFAGRSLGFRPSLSGSYPRHVVQASSRSLRRANPPAARSPAPGNTGPAAPGRPAAPVLAFVKLSPVPPRQASGWQPLRCGGGVAPIVHLRWNVLGATPTPALRVCFFCLGEFGTVRTKAPPEVHLASLRSDFFLAAANFSRMVLRRKSPGDRSQPLAQLRTAPPSSRSSFTP